MTNLNTESLRSNFSGDILQPGNPGYDSARRIWNASVDKRPALIAQCTGTADVITAVTFARDNNLLTAVRGGGHNVGWAETPISRQTSVTFLPASTCRMA